ncbi:hypothetical protein [Clostridium sardiniense]|uniref:hypothetical protein n=1 Tax=Clostridium sardiniense TaxID=29369 RepID=UPI001956352A|nr:hypothetical protein [Clostridium sardiniense]MBM7836440.1 hypothetical protein [Clostridium sardiniense]
MEAIQVELFKLFPLALDKIPEDFDFKDNIFAEEIKIGDSFEDKPYCIDIDLQIRIVGHEFNKLKIQSEAKIIDEHLKKYTFKTCQCRIIRKNIFRNEYYDNDKYNTILQYYIRQFK